MKYFFLFVVFLLPMNFSFAGEIYYCSEDEVTGFDPTASYQLKNFESRRFKAYVDLKDKKFLSDKLFFREDVQTKCVTGLGRPSVLYCISELGSAMAFDKKTLGFHYSSVFKSSDQQDQIYVSHGSCEKF